MTTSAELVALAEVLSVLDTPTVQSMHDFHVLQWASADEIIELATRLKQPKSQIEDYMALREGSAARLPVIEAELVRRKAKVSDS